MRPPESAAELLAQVLDWSPEDELAPEWFTRLQTTFRVGDRVRVRLSAECTARFYEVDDDEQPVSHEPEEHDWGYDGDVGTVVRVLRSEYGPLGLPTEGHHYLVETIDGYSCYFAAVELELISPAPTTTEEGDDGQR